MTYHLATYLSSDRSQGFETDCSFNIFKQVGKDSAIKIIMDDKGATFSASAVYPTQKEFEKAWHIYITYHADYIPDLTPDDIHLL